MKNFLSPEEASSPSERISSFSYFGFSGSVFGSTDPEINQSGSETISLSYAEG
jgi:hypothetical protein